MTLTAFGLETFLVGQFVTFTLVLSRVSGLMLTAPIFGSSAAPLQVRAFLAVAVSLLVLPAQLGSGPEYPGTTPNYLIYLAGEVLVGVTIGLGLLLLLGGIQVAGQIIGQLSGMALADVFNPTFDSESPVFGQLLYFVVLAVFVLMGGHRQLMAALLDTFAVIPPGSGFMAGSVLDTLIAALTQSFVVGIRAAAPVMTALLLATFVLGLISRTLPQLNILAVGFGLNGFITLGALLLSLGGAAWAFHDQFEPLMELLHQALLDDQSAAAR